MNYISKILCKHKSKTFYSYIISDISDDSLILSKIYKCDKCEKRIYQRDSLENIDLTHEIKIDDYTIQNN